MRGGSYGRRLLPPAGGKRYCRQPGSAHVWWRPRAPSAVACWWKAGTAGDAVECIRRGSHGRPLLPPAGIMWLLQVIQRCTYAEVPAGALCCRLLVVSRYCRWPRVAHVQWHPWSPSGGNWVLQVAMRHVCAVAAEDALCCPLLVEKGYCRLRTCVVALAEALCPLLLVESGDSRRFSTAHARWRPWVPSATSC